MNKTPLTQLVCILAAGSLAACATTPTRPPNPQVVAKMHAVDHSRMATAVIYRPSASLGGLLRPTVLLNGKDLVNVGNGKVFVAAVRPGHYTFEMDDKKSGTAITLKSGQEVYLKVEIVPGFWKGGGKLTQVATTQGEFEAVRLDLIEPREIEDANFR
jgi:Protein of unknown function (DUF2846)